MRVSAVPIVCAALVFGVANLFAGEAEPPVDPPKDPPKAPATNPAPTPKVVNDKQFHDALKKAAAVYKGYGRADDEVRWAPGLCRGPRPSAVRFSASTDEATHGRKLYWLFAKDRKNYIGDAKKPVPVGQVLVKESWIPEEVDKAPIRRGFPRGDVETTTYTPPGGVPTKVSSHIEPYITKDGKAYKAKAIGGLFVMTKLDPKTKGTDRGWVYGTLSADGKTVTSSGRVASCMKCHVDAPRDRLFGLPK